MGWKGQEGLSSQKTVIIGRAGIQESPIKKLSQELFPLCSQQFLFSYLEGSFSIQKEKDSCNASRKDRLCLGNKLWNQLLERLFYQQTSFVPYQILPTGTGFQGERRFYSFRGSCTHPEDFSTSAAHLKAPFHEKMVYPKVQCATLK